MSSLQNMLNVYFHMKNHYRKLKNVQSRVNTNNPRHSAGKPKKLCTKTKGPAMKERERPPTRRNTSDVSVSEAAKMKSSTDKYKTTEFELDSPIETMVNHSENIGEHEYLQFSLRVTEEIIRSDMYKSEDMIRVLKHHYIENKFRLEQDKLIITIAELCGQLKIQLDEKLMQFLNDGSSTVNMNYSADNHHNYNKTPSALILSKHKLNNTPTEFNETNQSLINMQNKQSQNIKLSLAQPSSMKEDTPQTSQHIPSGAVKCDDSTRTQQPNMSYSKESANCKDTILKSSEKDLKEDGCTANAKDNISQTFEFGEEFLKAPDADLLGTVNSDTKGMYITTLSDYEVLHDGSNKFVRDTDKESETSIETTVQTTSSQGPTQVEQDREKSTLKTEKNLVVTHYASSLEPKVVETKEFSTQASMDFKEILLCNTGDKCIISHHPVPHLNDSSTQRSFLSNSETILTTSTQDVIPTPQSDVRNSNSDFNPILKNRHCKRCTCYDDKEENISMGLSEQQYFLLDCPVLIPRNYSKSIDFLNSMVKSGEHYERNANTANLSPTSYRMNNSMINLGSGGVKADLAGGNYKMLPSRQYNEYDLTPQKDVYQKKGKLLSTSKQTAITRKIPVGCCSCMSENIATDKLMTNVYDKMDRSGKYESLDRIERYKEVRQKLSYFYPTTATQVSSTDLLSKEFLPQKAPVQHVRLHNKHQQYEKPPTTCDSQRNEQSYPPSLRNNITCEDSDTEKCSKPSKSCDIDTSLSMPLVKQPPTHLEKKERERTRIILDNYLIEVTQGKPKKSHGSEMIADRDMVKYSAASINNRNKSPIPMSLEEEVSIDKTLEYHTSSDSMAKRIQSLLLDIEKYSKNDVKSKRIKNSSKRSEVSVIFRHNSNRSSLHPTEVP